MDLKDIEMQKGFVETVVKNIKNNDIILDYYDRLSSEETQPLFNKIERMKNCNKFWVMDKYEQQKVKDYRRTNLCMDKFCNNCKKVKQSSRMSKYIPELEKYKGLLYHLILTVPNVEGEQLRHSIKLQFKAIKKLITYLNCNEKIRNLDFSSYGYLGAVRSLEITFKNEMYHPHIHCGMILQGNLGDKIYLNNYSYDYVGLKEVRAFTELEILIQKIWYLLYNDEKVTKKAIDELSIGYSCQIEKFEVNDYAELFKYMVKATDETSNAMCYQDFKNLYYALANIKQIQGYGCLYNITDNELELSVDEAYDKIINRLKERECPIVIRQEPKELLKGGYIVISRKRIYKYLKGL